MSVKAKVIFDTQVLLRATINRKSLPAKIFFDLRDSYELVASAATIAEARDVLNRPSLREKFSTLTDEVVQQTLSRLEQAQQPISIEVVPVSRDPKDDIFLACALANRAQYIVSEDKDLLVLNPYQGIGIVNVLAFLEIIRPPSSIETELE